MQELRPPDTNYRQSSQSEKEEPVPVYSLDYNWKNESFYLERQVIILLLQMSIALENNNDNNNNDNTTAAIENKRNSP